MNKDIVLIDLDGTIINSYPGIKMCVDHALDTMGFSISKESYPLFVGPPLHESFIKYASMTEEQALTATKIYRQLYVTEGLYKFDVYEGVEETLKELKARGKILSLATCKPQEVAIDELNRVDLAKYFNLLVGSISDYERSQKKEVIDYALKTIGCEEIDRCVMVGDTIFDLEGADSFGMDCIIVNYGFGSEKTRNKAAANIDNMRELLDIIK